MWCYYRCAEKVTRLLGSGPSWITTGVDIVVNISIRKLAHL